MRTVFLGSYGYGNLGDELCLIEAMQAFPSSEAHVWSNDPAFTAHAIGPRPVASIFKDRRAVADIRPDRVVLGGGGVGTLPMFADFLEMMAASAHHDPEFHIHNIGVANIVGQQWMTDAVRLVLGRLASLSVRDTVSVTIVERWGLGLKPRLTRYPERKAIPIRDWPFKLPEGKLLGLSMTSQPIMARSVEQNEPLLKSLFDAYPDHVIVPVVSTVHPTAADEKDEAGFRHLVQTLGLSGRTAMLELLQPETWRTMLDVDRLRALVARLDVLVSQRKHNCVHAFGTGVPAIGLHPNADDSLSRLFNTVAAEVPVGSRLFPLSLV
jgi:hypothetical protein